VSDEPRFDILSEFVIRFRALKDPRPAAVRVKAMLKYALRACALRNEGFVDQAASQSEAEPKKPHKGKGSAK
jgi:hypothetical protein